MYRNDNGTGAQTTNYAYTWSSGTLQAESVTVTYPTITTAQNGSNSAVSEMVVIDDLGKPVWTKDAAGYINYMAYDLATGAVILTIADVDTTQTSTFANLPSGWSTPGGGGLHADCLDHQRCRSDRHRKSRGDRVNQVHSPDDLICSDNPQAVTVGPSMMLV